MKNSIEKFTTENKDFSNEFYQHMAIIRRYDEVLSDKASKHSIYETETRLNDLYKPKMKTLDERITTNHKLITEQTNSMASFMEMMTKEIHNAVKKGVIKEMK